MKEGCICFEAMAKDCRNLGHESHDFSKMVNHSRDGSSKNGAISEKKLVLRQTNMASFTNYSFLVAFQVSNSSDLLTQRKEYRSHVSPDFSRFFEVLSPKSIAKTRKIAFDSHVPHRNTDHHVIGGSMVMKKSAGK
jgi:hypothetical protein